MKSLECRKPSSFLRWAGGKRWLSPYIEKFALSLSCDRYVEPFLGGGSVFFELSPNTALISDSNEELINTYIQIQKSPDAVENKLRLLPVNSKEYYNIRSNIPSNNIDRAVRFLYLNRTCFNGIWRTNKQGAFNVPYGQGTKDTNVIIGNSRLQLASKALQNVSIVACDYKETLSSVKKGDLVYCDPAYTVAHNNNSFRRYNEKVFAWQDQIDLHEHILSARDKGAIIITSNAAHESIADLYKPFKAIVVERASTVGVGSSRGKYLEYVYVISKNPRHRRKMRNILNASGICKEQHPT